MTPVSPLKHKYPLRARDKLSICTDLYRLCVINISLIGSIGKRVPQVSRLQVKLRLQDSGMDSVVPQITLQAICHLFLKTLPFLVCFRERPPEMRYGMYLVDVVAQPFLKVVGSGTHHRCLGDGLVGQMSAVNELFFLAFAQKGSECRCHRLFLCHVDSFNC